MNQRNGSMGLARCIPSDQQKITGYPSISKENQTLGILMRKYFLLLSLLLVSSQGQHESCPCINPWDYYNNSLSVDNCTLSNGEEGYLLQFQSQESIDCYPKEYGASCQNWDGLYRAKQCAGNGYDKEGSYCSSKWCFVDPLNCKILYQQSTLVVDVNAMDNVVYASYETCGNINAYNIDRYSTVFLNQTLTIAFPGDSSALYDLFTNSEGEKDGSSVRFFEDVQSFYNYNVDVVEISNISRQKYSSSYSACVHDVALGLVDLCVGEIAYDFLVVFFILTYNNVIIFYMSINRCFLCDTRKANHVVYDNKLLFVGLLPICSRKRRSKAIRNDVDTVQTFYKNCKFINCVIIVC